tara:strand:+ start:2180 stop:2338 length:159 start_codon:yes stop_codon:yes gene_type:complete
MKSKGLGDSVEKFTEATGIKSIVEKGARALGKDCGCGRRKDKLNELFPYGKK